MTEYSFDFFVMAGDATRDRNVNLQDFNVLASNFGHSNRTFSQGDFNYDGQVNLQDFNTLASRFGQVLSPAAGTESATQGTKSDDELPTWLEDLT